MRAKDPLPLLHQWSPSGPPLRRNEIKRRSVRVLESARASGDTSDHDMIGRKQQTTEAARIRIKRGYTIKQKNQNSSLRSAALGNGAQIL